MKLLDKRTTKKYTPFIGTLNQFQIIGWYFELYKSGNAALPDYDNYKTIMIQEISL